MPSTRVITQPPLPPGRACINCRRRKRKCDSERPKCSPCIKLGVGDKCAYDLTPEWLEVEVLTARVHELEEGIRNLTISLKGVASSHVLVGHSGRRQPPMRVPKPAGPLDVPVSLRDPFVGLLKQREVPRNIRDPLIRECLKHRRLHFPTQMNMSRFWYAYKLPPSHPESIHPALLDAMCLLGCLHGGDMLQPYERLFYARLQRSLYDSLENADRLLDFIRASTLAAKYCLTKSRCIEGQHRNAATVRFAMACGLHTIDTYDLNSPKLSLLKPPPKDLVDLGEIIHAWWNLFTVDRLGALLLRVHGTVAHDNETITTMWPCAFEDYESGRAMQAPHKGLSSLRSFESDPNLELKASAYDNVYAFRTQGCEMFYHAITLASSFREGHDVSHDATVAIRATSLLSDSIVSYRRRECPTFDNARNKVDCTHDCTLIFSMTITYGALIQLLHIFADKDPASYRQRVEAARACAKLAIEVCRVDASLLNVTIWLPWYSAYEVLSWEFTRLKKNRDHKDAAALRADLNGLMDAYMRFAERYSFQNNQDFQRLSRFDIHTCEVDTIEL